MVYLNHFVYNVLSALSYNISKDSFLVAKKWFAIGLFEEIIAIFSLPSFKALSKENQRKIYDKINELRVSNIDLVEKKKWLDVCREQLESACLEEKQSLVRVKFKQKRKE